MTGGNVPFKLKFWVKMTALERNCRFDLSQGLLTLFNRRVPPALDWQTWRRQLNHTGVDSDFTLKCVANVFALLKCPSAVH